MCGWRNWHVCPLRATAWCEHREMNRVRTGVDNMVCMHVRVSVCLSCRAVTCVELRASCRPSEHFSRFYPFPDPARSWQRPAWQRAAWHCDLVCVAVGRRPGENRDADGAGPGVPGLVRAPRPRGGRGRRGYTWSTWVTLTQLSLRKVSKAKRTLVCS